MSETEKETDDTPQQPKTLGQPLTVALITIGLVLVAFVLGQIIPKLLTAPTEKNISKTETPPLPSASGAFMPEPEMPEIPIEEVKKQIADIIENQEPPKQIADDSHNKVLETEMAAEIENLKAQHQKEIAELKDSLTLEHTEALKKASDITLGVIAFTELKDAINNGKAYSEQLNNLKKYINSNSEIEAIVNELAANSNQPITTQEALKLIFSELLKKAIISQETGVVKKIMNKFITIRKVGEVAGESDEAILARAEVKVKNHDFKAAIGEISSLSPASKLVFENWMQQANNRIDAYKNLERLQLFFTKTEGELQP